MGNPPGNNTSLKVNIVVVTVVTRSSLYILFNTSQYNLYFGFASGNIALGAKTFYGFSVALCS